MNSFNISGFFFNYFRFEEGCSVYLSVRRYMENQCADKELQIIMLFPLILTTKSCELIN